VHASGAAFEWCVAFAFAHCRGGRCCMHTRDRRRRGADGLSRDKACSGESRGSCRSDADGKSACRGEGCGCEQRGLDHATGGFATGRCGCRCCPWGRATAVGRHRTPRRELCCVLLCFLCRVVREGGCSRLTEKESVDTGLCWTLLAPRLGERHSLLSPLPVVSRQAMAAALPSLPVCPSCVCVSAPAAAAARAKSKGPGPAAGLAASSPTCALHSRPDGRANSNCSNSNSGLDSWRGAALRAACNGMRGLLAHSLAPPLCTAPTVRLLARLVPARARSKKTSQRTAIDKISWAPWQTASEIPCKTVQKSRLSFLPAQRKLVWSLLVAKIHGLTRNFCPSL
jgi:hypothetical protein